MVKQINIEFFDHQNSQSVEAITLESIKYAEKNLFDIILFDTAGRQVVDNKMMEELKIIAQKLNNHFDDIDATLTAYSHGPTITKKYSEKYIRSNFYVKRVYNNM